MFTCMESMNLAHTDTEIAFLKYSEEEHRLWAGRTAAHVNKILVTHEQSKKQQQHNKIVMAAVSEMPEG